MTPKQQWKKLYSALRYTARQLKNIAPIEHEITINGELVQWVMNGEDIDIFKPYDTPPRRAVLARELMFIYLNDTSSIKSPLVREKNIKLMRQQRNNMHKGGFHLPGHLI